MRRRSTATSRSAASTPSSQGRFPRGNGSSASQHSLRRPVVVPLFVAVPGRARLSIEGLRGQPAVATLLESRLSTAPAVHRGRASAVTGNVLVLFEPRSLELRRLVDQVSRYAGQTGNGTTGTTRASRRPRAL